MIHKKTRLITLIDFSLYSHALIELGNRWCKIANAELLLMHKVDALVPGMADSETRDQITGAEKDEALAKLTKLANEKVSDSIHVDFHVSPTSLLLSLPELLKEGYNDYILLGIKGTGMLKKLLMGSTAIKIIDEVNHSIVAVPDKLCISPDKLCNLLPKKIIVTLSYKYPLNEPAFNNFLNTFKTTISEIQFISVVHSEETEEKSSAYLSALSNKYHETVSSTFKVFIGKNVLDEIKNHVQKDGDTILVVQKGSRSLTDELFRKFLVNQLVHDGSIPLIILPL